MINYVFFWASYIASVCRLNRGNDLIIFKRGKNLEECYTCHFNRLPMNFISGDLYVRKQLDRFQKWLFQIIFLYEVDKRSLSYLLSYSCTMQNRYEITARSFVRYAVTIKLRPLSDSYELVLSFLLHRIIHVGRKLWESDKYQCTRIISLYRTKFCDFVKCVP